MRISNLFKEKELVFSFEIFPPKVTSPIETIYDTLEGLKDLKPDYISVTYGAAGSSPGNKICELSSLIKNKYDIEPLAHLTCINSNKDFIKNILDELKENNVENILALRGDVLGETKISKDFNNACKLIEYIKKNKGFGISAACYPEGHIESKNLKEDIEVLKVKVESGAEHLISQLFFDNNCFYNFLDKVEQKGLNVPIQAGIMPVTNKKQIERIVSLCGSNVPLKFIKIMEKYEHDKEALRDAGIAYAMDQIVDLISTGVRGIHLYTMNNPYIARKINENISSVINSINRKQVS
ncbi:methylenetetrahydrofolate reductase [NAD(P)H] [Clostridium frigidicarnis]|uniref:Methylenetetrahydrofolate reductase n=1 Tax=Clostridium frigidicarnis TaxID=84698 RepID=A0A1I1B8C8_9CLOT|nr:methylenetetrahydrofolate reductase [NAD(P)H] [Clostridium frigidicarnis]SFB46655.1 5,10-methylenetetrahydrofolate reductase (NAD(P)) [Clostridium frigidicarnis]